MKRATKVNKTDRGEQEPFSRQLANAHKENARLREECRVRIEAVERKAGQKIDAACAAADAACAAADAACAAADAAEGRELDATEKFGFFLKEHEDFARAARVLHSRSILRRLWWGLRFGLWGVFGYEMDAKRKEL